MKLTFQSLESKHKILAKIKSILVYGIREMLDMDLSSVKYEVPDTTLTQNRNSIHSQFIQDLTLLTLRTSAQVCAGCPYLMATHDSEGVNYIISSVCNSNKNTTFESLKHRKSLRQN